MISPILKEARNKAIKFALNGSVIKDLFNIVFKDGKIILKRKK